MNASPESVIPLVHLVLIGGGHAHIHVLKMFASQRLDNLRITLIGRDVETPYSGMLPGYITGQYTFAECHIDLLRFCSWAKIRFLHAEVCKLSTSRKLIYCSDNRPPIRYDVLSIDIGIVPRPLPCFANSSSHRLSEVVVPVKPIDKFTRLWQSVIQSVSSLGINSSYTVAIVGAGAGGVELALAVNFRLKQVIQAAGGDPAHLHTILINKASAILPNHCPAVRTIMTRLLGERQVVVHNNADIVDIQLTDGQEHFLLAADGRQFAFQKVFWCTQAVAAPWLGESGLAVDEDHFIKVHPTLQSINCAHVFAAGDVCNNIVHPRPKAGVFAVRAGPPLYANLRAHVLGQALTAWEPQTEFLGIISIGQGYAVASKGGMGLEGAHLYELKEKIDRGWMLPYQQLTDGMAAGSGAMGNAPPAAGSEPTIASTQKPDTLDMLYHATMRCGGCGSKVGASVLSRALKKAQRYVAHSRNDVILGMGDDCAVVAAPSNTAMLVHTIDYFRGFIDDLFVLGQVAANHALSDIFSMNASPATALALIALPLAQDKILEDDLVQVLAGIGKVLRDCNCALVGGHTSEGVEMALGLAITGYVANQANVLYKSIYQRSEPLHLEGQAQELMSGLIVRSTSYLLIVTKAVGTGVIFAANMRGKVRGAAVKEAVDSMLLSNQPAAHVLAADDSSRCLACTDLTGFGLLGHLVEMLKHPVQPSAEEDSDEEDVCQLPSPPIYDFGVKLTMSTIPLLDGAMDCVHSNILSSLQPSNARSARAIANIHDAQRYAQYPLLFDPQTSGGLLAFVHRDHCQNVLREIRAGGCRQAEVIGELLHIDSNSNTSSSAGQDVPLVYLAD